MYTRLVEPIAASWRNTAWPGGTFDTAHRPYTPAVEGTIRTAEHVVLVTLTGGAERLEVSTDCGHRFDGVDGAGAVSLVPAHCERRMRMRGVSAEWASVSLSPRLLSGSGEDGGASIDGVAPFTNIDDPFLSGLVADFRRVHAMDGGLDLAYCETMTHALACYLSRRYGQGRSRAAPIRTRLSPWRLRRIESYVEAHIDRQVSIADLARLVGMSEGHLHRAFRATTGVTPLRFINERRIRRAMEMMTSDARIGIDELALAVGFQSPSYFSRAFRSIAGVNPSRFRAELGSRGDAPRRPR